MKIHKIQLSPFIISVTAVFVATIGIIICAIYWGSTKIIFETELYFVCYTVRDNALSADAISDTVSNYGGAGYVLEYEGEYYVTIACYYTENDAERVRLSLLRRGLTCSVLTVERDEYFLKSPNARSREQLFKGNLNTLHSLSRLCYDCANRLDTGEYSQNAAKGVLDDVLSALNGLKLANGDNCFSNEIRRLIAECEGISGGFIHSKDMRKLQIAIADTIINIELY